MMFASLYCHLILSPTDEPDAGGAIVLYIIIGAVVFAVVAVVALILTIMLCSYTALKRSKSVLLIANHHACTHVTCL